MKRFSTLVLILATAVAAWAVPARRGGVVITQPDGTQVTVYQHGDEYFHWMTNEKGEWLKQGADGMYRVTEALSDQAIATKRMAASMEMAAQKRVATELNIAPHGLVILVNFKDVQFTTSIAEMDSMLRGKNYVRNYTYKHEGKTHKVQSKGSAWKYFYDSSNGQYDPDFDVVGPVTMANNMAYYGKTVDNFDAAPWTMVKEACELVDDEVDFSQYDNNGDGYVDFVYVVYAGYGEADGGGENTIWPHSYWLTEIGVSCKVDGKRVDLYACGNELDFRTKKHTGIGTFCHEFSHVLGLPDMYKTKSGSHKTLGEWSILDYGPYSNDGNTPPTYSAYERFFMGWLQPELIVNAANIQLEDIQTSNRALLISTSDEHNLIGNDPKPTKFYLLENRQQTGWDKYLPGHGMMLTYIRYQSTTWADNSVNNIANRMGVDLIEADGETPSAYEEGYDGKAGDLFPFGATEYTEIEGHPIEQIEEKEGIIYFQYKGGGEGPETDVDHVIATEEVIAIYTILGQKQTTTDIERLPRGAYVVVTNSGSKKVIR